MLAVAQQPAAQRTAAEGPRAYSCSSKNQAYLRTRQLIDSVEEHLQRVREGRVRFQNEDQKADDLSALNLLKHALESLQTTILTLENLPSTTSRNEALRMVDRARKDVLAVARACADRVTLPPHRNLVDEVVNFSALNSDEVITPRTDVSWRCKNVPVNQRQQRRDQERKNAQRPRDSLVDSIVGLSAIAEGRDAEASSPTLGFVQQHRHAHGAAEDAQGEDAEATSARPSALEAKKAAVMLLQGIPHRDTSAGGDDRSGLQHVEDDSPATTMCNMDSCASQHRQQGGTAGHTYTDDDEVDDGEDEVSSASRDGVLPHGTAATLLAAMPRSGGGAPGTAAGPQLVPPPAGRPQDDYSHRRALSPPPQRHPFMHMEIQPAPAEEAVELQPHGGASGPGSRRISASGQERDGAAGRAPPAPRSAAMADAASREVATHANRSYLGRPGVPPLPIAKQRGGSGVAASAAAALVERHNPPAPPQSPLGKGALPVHHQSLPGPAGGATDAPPRYPTMHPGALPHSALHASQPNPHHVHTTTTAYPGAAPHSPYSPYGSPGALPPLHPHPYAYAPGYPGMGMPLHPHHHLPAMFYGGPGVGYGSLPPSGPSSLRDFPLDGGRGERGALPCAYRNIAGPGTDVNVPVGKRGVAGSQPHSNKQSYDAEWENASLAETEPLQGRQTHGGRRRGGGLFGLVKNVVGFMGVSMLSGAAMVLSAAAVNTSLDEQQAAQQARASRPAGAGSRKKGGSGSKRLGRGGGDLIPQRTLQQLRSPDLLSLGRG